MQVIYIDMLFLLNLVMDYMIFWMSSKLLGYRVSAWKVFVASLLAALIYCLGIIILWTDQIPIFLLQLIVPILSILYLYRPKDFKVFIKTYIVATIVAAVVGGVSFNLYFIIGSKTNVSVWLPLGTGMFLCLVLFLLMGFVKKRLITPYFEYEVIICQGNQKRTLWGYLDTGNRLYTTLDQQPVMIADYGSIERILSDSQRQFLKVCEAQGIESALELLEGRKDEKYYLIPFSSIGCKDGIIVGIPIEKMYVKRGCFEKVIEGGIVAIHFGKLFNGDVYDMLIHPEYVKS
ncbi:MAG: sigma-E processing peptidase SpoIIGA [Cellulosilyticaceae bacterium]